MTRKKRNRRQPATKQHLPSAPQQTSSPEWVQQMHAYFRENGYYRPEDLQRVLGDPRDQAETELPIDMQLASRNTAI